MLGTIIFAALLAAWSGSRAMFQGGLAVEPADGHLAGVPLTTTAAAIHPLEAVAASLAPEEPEPAPEAPPVAVPAVEPEAPDGFAGQPPSEPQPAPEPIVAAGEVLAPDAGQQPLEAPESQPELASAAAPADAPALRVTAVGDSVMLAAASELALAISGIEVDAEVGRVVSTAIDILRARRNTGQLGDVVVVHIGNNSPFSPSQFDEMMDLLVDVSRVVFVNLKVPRDWEGPNNAVLAQGVALYSNAVLADWYTVSVDQPQFFLDGVHLRPVGAQAYAQLIAAAVAAP